MQMTLFNTAGEQQIFHPFPLWECHKAGFFANQKQNWTHAQCEAEFVRILSDCDLFGAILERVIVEWRYSCEHWLTNESMNRIAWLGQAAVCHESGVPSRYCSAWRQLTDEQQEAANQVALRYLNRWLVANSRPEVTMRQAVG